MKKALSILFLFSLSLLHGQDAQPTEPSPKWIQLFNGKDLEGWTPKFATRELGENYKKTFVVENGILKVNYDNWTEFKGEFGHLFYKTPYSHYRIRATYRFVGKQLKGGPQWAIRNNGLMLHCQDPKTMEKDQEFPDSIEVQFLGGLGKEDRGTLNICTPGTQLFWQGKLTKSHVINTGGPTFHGDQWVTVEVEVRGDTFKHIINGKTVCEYSKVQLDDGTPLTSGYISIQAETGPTEFKSIELLPLKK